MMTFGLAQLLTTTGTAPTRRDRLTVATLTATTAAALAATWLFGWAIYRTFGVDLLITTAPLAMLALGARLLHTPTPGAGFAPAMHTAVTVLTARPATVAGRWARLGLTVPTTLTMIPTRDGGAAVTLALRPGQTGAHLATRTALLADLFGVRAVDIFTGHPGRVSLALHP